MLILDNLIGEIPLLLYNVSTIEHFVVHTNELGGNLPPDLGNTLPNLKIFHFHTNDFSGIIPATMSNASNLVHFDVSHNSFTGKLPSFKSSSNLECLIANINNLGHAEAGDFDFLLDAINITSLKYLEIMDNNFGGAIPETIGNATSTGLRRIAFGHNRITGNIPLGIGNLVGLELLALEDNHLIGQIPSTIGKMRTMKSLHLEGNKLSGEIPQTLGNLTWLISLSMERNNIQGVILPSLGECRNLQALSLAENNLSGPIPSQLLSLSRFSIELNLSRNRLTGSIPAEVGKLESLGVLDFSENKLSGKIPKSLGGCISLEYLFLQGNFLQGSIPMELNSLRGVRVIGLSRNNLSGRVPVYFSEFRGLEYLDFSFNELEGPVPVEGIFKNLSKFSVVGNTRLCGGVMGLKLLKCTSDARNKHALSHKAKVAIIVAFCLLGGLTAIILFVVTIFVRSKRRTKPAPQQPIGDPLPRVSYGDLSKATDGFSTRNLIGVGRFGSVYEGTLNQEDKPVAVKVLNLEVSRALKSFVAECETLRMLRHKNVIKLVTVCSSIDFQGNDFKALIYEFMENGNLEEWLHSGHTRQGQIRRSLNLIQRIDIAVDVASSLDYLHNQGPEATAHCDVKPSNILLDGQMVAHLGDFGLAKLLTNTFPHPFSSSNTQSSSIGGTIGYVAPEYATGNEVSTSGDIYSYGVLLLEIFTGKRPTDGMFKDDFNIHRFASTMLPERIREIADPVLLDEEHRSLPNGVIDQVVFDQCLVSIIEIGVACSSTSVKERRNMNDVSDELRRIRQALMPRN